MKRSDTIQVFKFSIEKVWKMVFENVWEPWFIGNIGFNT